MASAGGPPGIAQEIAGFKERGHYEDAALAVERHLRGDPRDADGYRELAVCLAALGRRDLALLNLQIAEELSDDATEALSHSLAHLLHSEQMASAKTAFAKSFRSNDPPRVGSDHARLFHESSAARFVNIGGGPNFSVPDWLNIDEFGESRINHRAKLDSEVTLPAMTGTAEIVYSSHCLEHLNDATIAALLPECHRILNAAGSLVIKIPDYQALLANYRAGRQQHFADDLWNFPVMTPTWPRRDVPDTIDTRCAYLICGFWNQAFGHLFGDHDVNAPGAYHGPPAMPLKDLKRLLADPSPNRIARELRDFVLESETDYAFNHQNAWNLDEFDGLLRNHGFRLLTSNAGMVRQQYRGIPGIDEMADISAYFVAVPE